MSTATKKSPTAKNTRSRALPSASELAACLTRRVLNYNELLHQAHGEAVVLLTARRPEYDGALDDVAHDELSQEIYKALAFDPSLQAKFHRFSESADQNRYLAINSYFEIGAEVGRRLGGAR